MGDFQADCGIQRVEWRPVRARILPAQITKAAERGLLGKAANTCSLFSATIGKLSFGHGLPDPEGT